MDLKNIINRCQDILTHSRKAYNDNKNANLSKFEYVSMQLKHQAIGKIELLESILPKLRACAGNDDTSENSLHKHIVSGSASEADYWSERCKLAEAIEEENPCDSDVTSDQIKAWNNYHNFIKTKGQRHYR